MKLFTRLSVLGGLVLAPALAQASLTIVSGASGVPTANVNYLDFRSISLGSGMGMLAGNTSDSADPLGTTMVNMRADARIMRDFPPTVGDFSFDGSGSTSNGDGSSLLRYVRTGASTGSQAEFVFDEGQRYLGLLWGSVDAGNTLTFYFTDNTSQSISGSQISPDSTGLQGMAGAYYVNVTSDKSFDRVVASTSDAAFEFSNLAFSTSAIVVPEAGTMAIWGLGLGCIGGLSWLRRRRS